jgi:hypothetical protein
VYARSSLGYTERCGSSVQLCLKESSESSPTAATAIQHAFRLYQAIWRGQLSLKLLAAIRSLHFDVAHAIMREFRLQVNSLFAPVHTFDNG